MTDMFYKSSYNGNRGDISNWDVSNVTTMKQMFVESRFRGNISNWNVSNVTDMEDMFTNSRFNGNLRQWHIQSFDYNPFKGSNIPQRNLPLQLTNR
jgi:hypothetical protein